MNKVDYAAHRASEGVLFTPAGPYFSPQELHDAAFQIKVIQARANRLKKKTKYYETIACRLWGGAQNAIP